jgi:hypothetical protein
MVYSGTGTVGQFRLNYVHSLIIVELEYHVLKFVLMVPRKLKLRSFCNWKQKRRKQEGS